MSRTTNRTANPSCFPREQYDACPVPLIGLTYDWTALNTKVDSMVANGNTNQAIGLAWAWQSLTEEPFTIPTKDPNYQYSEVIILMSDGLNTENRWTTSQIRNRHPPSNDVRQRQGGGASRSTRST